MHMRLCESARRKDKFTFPSRIESWYARSINNLPAKANPYTFSQARLFETDGVGAKYSEKRHTISLALVLGKHENARNVVAFQRGLFLAEITHQRVTT